MRITVVGAPARRGFVALVVVSCLVGVVVSAELAWVHYKVHTDPTHRSLCAISAELDCDAVAAAPEAALLGVPNAVWALYAYGLVLWLALRARRNQVDFPVAPRTWLFWAALGMAAYSGWLVVVSVRELTAFCVFCAVLWGVNAVLLVAALATASVAAPLAGLRAEIVASRRRPGRALSLGGGLLAIAVALVLGVPRLYPGPAILADAVAVPPGGLPHGLARIGAEDAPHVLLEISDYRCPFCRRAHRTVERVLELLPGELRVVHAQFPLDASCNPGIDVVLHEGACDAAIAAECAGLQGRFREMNAALFAEDGDWTSDIPMLLAARIGLDLERFERCVRGTPGTPDAAEARAAVKRGVDLGLRLGIEGTPALYLDGRELSGSVTVPALREVVRALP